MPEPHQQPWVWNNLLHDDQLLPQMAGALGPTKHTEQKYLIGCFQANKDWGDKRGIYYPGVEDSEG